MLDLFYSTAAAIIGLLLDVLPDSPVSDWLADVAMQDNAIVTGLGWLNWLVDINACLIIFNLWLVALVAFYGVRFGVGVFGGVGGVLRTLVGRITG